MLHEQHSRNGPLAQVWLAANYEKKLSKQQFLNTNLVTSSQLVGENPLNDSSSKPSELSGITLRLSGQLLLGIVRIYSRKTKYLLDDVNDILFKLKNSFKYASGGVLLGSEVNNSNHINQPRTILSNVSNIILNDQVTDHDLLYQEDLNLDDYDDDQVNLFNSQPSGGQEHNDTSIDQSIEYGRFNDADFNNDVDIDLDFDLDGGANDNDNSDRSIEVGRNVSVDVGNGPDISMLPELDDGGEKDGEITFDFDPPLDTIDNDDHDNAQTPPEVGPTTPQDNDVSAPRSRKQLVGITESGTLKTTKRKLQVDSDNELNSGITIDQLKEIQQLQRLGISNASYNFYLTDQEKLQLIQDLSTPFTKKRKLGDLNKELTQLCDNLSTAEQQQNQQEEDNNQDPDQTNDNGLDFDLSLPDFDNSFNNEPPTDFYELPPSQYEDDEDFDGNINGVAQGSKKMAKLIKDEVEESNSNSVNFDQIIKRDTNSTTEDPFGTNNRLDGKKLNMKKEASRCFFELLTLASQDGISINEDLSDNSGPGKGKDINITSKHSLFTNFI